MGLHVGQIEQFKNHKVGAIRVSVT